MSTPSTSEPTACARARWLLERVAGPAPATVDEVEEAMVVTPRRTAPSLREGLARWAEYAGSMEVLDLKAVNERHAKARVVHANGQVHVYDVWIELAPPHRIEDWVATREAADGVLIREMRDEDGAALCDLERRSPLRLGQTKLTYDRRDWFDQARLMERHGGGVGEVHGEIAGVMAAGFRMVRMPSGDVPSVYSYRVRIDPAHQRSGVYSAMFGNAVQSNLDGEGRPEKERSAPMLVYGYVAARNERMLSFIDPRSQWRERVLRLLVRCEPGAPLQGRAATPADAPRIVELLNATHGQEAMFIPYTVASLTERLERAPDLYGWDDVLLGDRAVVGVWDSQLGVHREDADGSRRSDVRATVLDYGCEPGAEAELVSLLRGAAASLAPDTTELALYSSRPSPACPELVDLAADIEEYVQFVIAPEPDPSELHGVHVDPIYF